MFEKVMIMCPVLNIPGLRVGQNSEYISGFECARDLNMPLVLITQGFWIYQSSVYAGVTQDSEYAWICLVILIACSYHVTYAF